MATRKKSATAGAEESGKGNGGKRAAKTPGKRATKRRGKLAPGAKARGLDASQVAIALEIGRASCRERV